MCAVDLTTGREVSVVADCVFQKVEDALQKVSSADAVRRVAVLVTVRGQVGSRPIQELSRSNAGRIFGSCMDSGADESKAQGVCSIR